MNEILNNNFYRDVFLSHASVDKNQYVFPFVEALKEREISYWLDEAELKWGHSLLTQLSEGLLKSRFVIVFISDEFLSRNWPQAELRAALNEEISSGEIKVLPIIICDIEKCLKKHPFLRDKKYLKWKSDVNSIIYELEKLLGRSYSEKWSFIHPPEFRGHVWIKIIPKKENKNTIHGFTINWGRWRYIGKLEFNEDTSVILDFRKIAEENSYPIDFLINPSAFVISGKGNPVIDINKGWKCIDKTGLREALFDRTKQSVLPDTDEKNARLIIE